MPYSAWNEGDKREYASQKSRNQKTQYLTIIIVLIIHATFCIDVWSDPSYYFWKELMNSDVIGPVSISKVSYKMAEKSIDHFKGLWNVTFVASAWFGLTSC